MKRYKKNRKKCLKSIRGIIFISVLLAFLLQESTFANDVETKEETVKKEILDQLDDREMNQVLEDIFPEENLNFKDTVLSILSGEQKISAELLWRLAKDQFTGAFTKSRENLIHILVIAIIAAIFHNFSSVLKSKQICEISFYILYLLLIALCLKSFGLVLEWVSAGIKHLTMFMSAFGPIYFLAVSIAKGSVTAVAFYNLVLFFIYLIEILIVSVLLPVIHIYIMVKVLDFLSSQEYLSKLAELIEIIVSWSLKTLLACVVGVNVVQGMISPAIDTVKRSALTRTAEAIPGVGDALGGVAEVALGTAVLVKNGIGITGLIICLALCIVPLAQTAMIALMYKLAAALIQPVSDRRVVGCVECVGDGCRLLMQVVFTTGLLFLLTIVIVSFVTSSV